MKTIHQINKWALIVTLVLYCTVYLGMLAQIVLGTLQLFFAITVTGRYYKELPIDYQKLIKRYWISVTLSGTYIGIVYWIDSHYSNDFYMITSLFVIPMAIAVYFVFITKKISSLYNGEIYK